MSELEKLSFDPYAKVEIGAVDPLTGTVKPQSPTGPGTGTKEWTDYMSMRRRALQKIDPDLHHSGRPRLKPTRREAEEAALDKMVPRALKLLREQMESPDERVSQSAAVKVLEYARGKPVAKVQAEVAGVQKIVYESAAFVTERQALESQAAHILELTSLVEEDDESEGSAESEA